MATDLDWLKALVQLMNQNDLAELSLEEEGRKVRLRKSNAFQPKTIASAPAAAAASSASAPAKGGAPAAPAASEKAPRADGVVEVLSPMVGTFYRASSPEADPYVDVGDAVKEDATLCIIEAMKVMNEIKAEMEGTIEEILVSNGEAVEYGQPLFLLKKAK